MLHRFINIKTFLLFSLIQILGLYTLFGVNEEAETNGVGEKVSNVDNKGDRPKFKKIKIVNEVKNYTTQVSINEEIMTDSGRVTKAEYSSSDRSFNIESEGIKIATFRLRFMDKRGDLIVSDNKTVYWPSPDKADELKDIFGSQLPGINVRMERNPEDKNSLLIVIEGEDGMSDRITNYFKKLYDLIR